MDMTALIPEISTVFGYPTMSDRHFLFAAFLKRYDPVTPPDLFEFRSHNLSYDGSMAKIVWSICQQWVAGKTLSEKQLNLIKVFVRKLDTEYQCKRTSSNAMLASDKLTHRDYMFYETRVEGRNA